MIEIYSTPTCHYCNIAKEYFKKNNLEYIEYNVKDDLDKRKEMIEISGQMGVPVIVIKEDVLIGFNKEDIDKVIRT